MTTITTITTTIITCEDACGESPAGAASQAEEAASNRPWFIGRVRDLPETMSKR